MRKDEHAVEQWSPALVADCAALQRRIVANLWQSLWFYNPYSPNCRNNFPSDVGYFVIRIGNHCFYNPTSAYANT